LFFADASFEESARIHAGRIVSLEIHQIAAMRIGLAVKKMIETHVVQSGCGGKTCDMSAQLGRIAIGIQHQHHRIPAHPGADAVFQILVAGGALLFANRDGVAIRRGRAERHARTGIARLVEQFPEQKTDAFRAFVFQNRLEGIQPLLGFLRIVVR
jgi:hypothetical protein